jgi:hypothetical protein
MSIDSIFLLYPSPIGNITTHRYQDNMLHSSISDEWMINNILEFNYDCRIWINWDLLGTYQKIHEFHIKIDCFLLRSIIHLGFKCHIDRKKPGGIKIKRQADDQPASTIFLHPIYRSFPVFSPLGYKKITS